MQGGTRPLIEFRHVTVEYGPYITALKDCTFSIHEGEFVFIVGRTGTGKSTCLKLLSREVIADRGQVLLDNVDLGKLHDRDVPMHRRKLGIVPQDFGLLPRKKAWENIAYAMRAVGKTKREVRDSIRAIVERVNIAHRIESFPSQLSGGEQQRVSIARALINDPQIILADEPTGNLDSEHSMEIMQLLLDLNEKGATVIVATHDLHVLDQVKKRTITFEKGGVVSDETPNA
jgi:cell division transport system ATP-binding protein